ncbi:helix-turn-helix transcriptional regulator [Chitinophaga ginsengisoli]|uniref:AraC-like DNA-binding protein n=1 Tax=Chitinophaga ginsengisoli TaxID=363837 RepID=A0A2P8GHG9_9BACT|nr:AraC family transcriptional regulator [Chitinophaga ginsengisoli]PSL33397.1 AraC-like DNA-binding protein [Chitinophaga ginsengisoli]
MTIIQPLYPIHQIEEIKRFYTREQTAGPEISAREIRMGETRMLWYSYLAEKEYHMPMQLRGERVEMHFKLHGRSGVSYEGEQFVMHSNEQSLFYQHDLEGEFILFPDVESSFFEVEFSRSVFESLVTEECPFLQQFSQQLQTARNHLWPGHSMAITPKMHMIISEMGNTPYTGQMKRLFLEAKLIELFLLQASGFDQYTPHITDLRSADIERLHAARQYLEQHFTDDCSIISLAGQVGINQKKLKQGFKALFGHTVFGYLSHIRMEKARQLLLDEKKTVGEVSELVGYQHPQHFAAAFKRKYNILPGSLKN